MYMNSAEKIIEEVIKQEYEAVCEISDAIWEYAEPRFEEYKSAELLIAYFEKHGFAITRNIGGLETAFIAEYGTGKPIAGVLGEYDALQSLAQVADETVEKHYENETGCGHGCGHNLLGAAAALSAIALKGVIDSTGKGTVRYYGCPAEENGAGKSFMCRAGAFDDVDFAVTWHPSDRNSIMKSGALAVTRKEYQFQGISSHASGAPHLGRSALDSVELMNIGVNYMREHVIPEARMHYAVLDTGGIEPNIVQSHAVVEHIVRAPKTRQVADLSKRIDNIARGAALMSETTVYAKTLASYMDFHENKPMNRVIAKHLENNLPEYDEEDMKYASKMRKVLPKVDISQTLAEFSDHPDFEMWVQAWNNMDLCPIVIPPMKEKASTDVGDVSFCTPTAFFFTACCALGTPGHSWQLTSQMKSSVAHKGMRYAAQVMAKSSAEIMQSEELLEEIKKEFKKYGGYKPLLPDEDYKKL